MTDITIVQKAAGPKENLNLRKMLRQFTPAQTLLAGFILIILTGSTLLTLPIASSRGVSQPFIDALFTATSAISTTGLVVVDTGSFYSLFGQIVIIILVQIGGLGYMVFIVFIAYVFGKKLSFRASMLLEDSLAGVSLGNIKKIIQSVIWFTLLFELVGAAILSLFWMREFSVSRSIYLGIFHSIFGREVIDLHFSIHFSYDDDRIQYPEEKVFVG
jgi:trk system potassium uptake protein TrkH